MQLQYGCRETKLGQENVCPILKWFHLRDMYILNLYALYCICALFDFIVNTFWILKTYGHIQLICFPTTTISCSFKEHHIQFGFEVLSRIPLRYMPHTNMRLNFHFYMDQRRENLQQKGLETFLFTKAWKLENLIHRVLSIYDYNDKKKTFNPGSTGRGGGGCPGN